VRTAAFKQRGIGVLGFLTIAVMVGFFVMSAIRIAPGYIEYLTVKDVAMRVASEFNRDEDRIADMRRSFADYLNTNQVKSISYKDIIIERREGQIIIDASYEERIPMVWRIDAVVKYDDLVFVAGEKYDD